MKKIAVAACFLFLMFSSCTKHEFNNPIDPGNPPLKAASNLTVSAFTDTSVVLSWTNTNAQLRTGTIQVIVVERSLDKTKYDLLIVDTLETVGNTLTAYYNFNPDTNYYFRIRQFFGGRTDGEYTAPTTAISWKLKPTNLTYSFYDDTKLKLIWTDNSTIETGFEIEQSTDNITFAKITDVLANVTTADIPGTYLSGTNYYFRVKAKSTYNVSTYSNITTAAIVFNAPTNLTYSFYYDTKLKLSWTDNSTIETGFEIEQSIDNITFAKITEVAANTTTVDVTGSYLSQIYYFRVRAKTSINYSNYSSQITTILVAPTGFVFVQGGNYTMGSSSGYSDEIPLHTVTLSSYYISKTEVTQGQYKAVMGTNPSYFSSVGDNGPVEQVTWYDCISYCNKLSIQQGKTPCYSIRGNTSPSDWTSGTIVCNFTAKGYRLATEAEWEYAARGGNKSAGYTYSGSNTVDDVAWNTNNSGSTTHTVGTKTANELGINDMSGNVWEWCWDWYSSYTSSSQTNPTGATSGSSRVLRGGSWSYNDYNCRSSFRYYFNPDYSNYKGGFRLVQE